MQFLRGRFREEAQVLRPPWAQREERFVLSCERCEACVRACPTRILKTGSGRFPMVDFSQGECTFCGDCVEACPSGALQKTSRARGEAPWSITASILQACLALNNVVCRSCGEACEARAIRFEPAVIARPELNEASCTGCGACVAVCPAHAIQVIPAAIAA